MTATAQPTAPPEAPYFRWLQLAMGVVCMAMIANLQYGWTLFVDPIDAKYHWGRAAIQLAFTLFVVTETWLVPLRRSHRREISLGPGCDPVGLYAVRGDGDLAGPDRSVVRR